MEKRSVKVAILDLYDGYENQGMRCIRTLLKEWAETNDLDVQSTEFNVRQKDELPDTSYDVYISSGGPGDPLKSRFEDWDIAWIRWLDNIVRWNKNPNTTEKKHVFFICHSFQLACRYFNAGIVCKRKSNSFGVFPMHMLEAGKDEPVLNGLKDPFYAVDSRDFQVIQPNHQLLNEMGASILCIEKKPSACSRQSVIENHGEEKLNNMLEHLSDPDKILWTYSHIIPNFLNQSIEQLQEVMA